MPADEQQIRARWEEIESIYEEASLLRGSLQEIARVSIPEVNPDGVDQAAHTMRLTALEGLEHVGADVPEQRVSAGLPPEMQTTEQMAVEYLHEWLAQRGESYRYAVVRPQANEPASVADLEVLLVGDHDYENATDQDPILGNALLGALGKVLAQREAATTDAQEGTA